MHKRYNKTCIRGPFPSLEAKNADFFKQISQKREPLIDTHPPILNKISPTLCRKVSNLLLAANFKSFASNESPS